jgi:hypothetical protein
MSLPGSLNFSPRCPWLYGWVLGLHTFCAFPRVAIRFPQFLGSPQKGFGGSQIPKCHLMRIDLLHNMLKFSFILLQYVVYSVDKRCFGLYGEKVKRSTGKKNLKRDSIPAAKSEIIYPFHAAPASVNHRKSAKVISKSHLPASESGTNRRIQNRASAIGGLHI